MEVAVHVGVGECGQVLATVLLLETHFFVPFLGICLSLENGPLDDLHFLFNVSEVIVPFP